ncbi:MAG TPA: hypothetical protein VEU77_13470, partial [Candidatus Acidoferrales bacterium]|nr:hypothetical protein [Candidatus Acidoferrales bacterium]
MRRWIGPLLGLLVAACGGATNAQPAAPNGSFVPVSQRLIVEGDDATRLLDPNTGATVATLPGGVVSPTLDLIVNTMGGAP